MKKKFLDIAKAYEFTKLSYCTYKQFGLEHYQLELFDASDNKHSFKDMCEVGDAIARISIIQSFTEFVKNIPS